jgi:hypothetical protein
VAGTFEVRSGRTTEPALVLHGKDNNEAVAWAKALSNQSTELTRNREQRKHSILGHLLDDAGLHDDNNLFSDD